MKIELTKPEQQFLINVLLKEIQSVEKTKSAFNVFDKDDPKAQYFYDSFWQLDKFVHSIYKKLCV